MTPSLTVLGSERKYCQVTLVIDRARCHERIEPHEVWRLDHSDSRAGYIGVSHAL